MSMGSFRESCALSWLSGSRTDVPTQHPSHRPYAPLTSPADELKLQSLKIDDCGPSSVIKIVKMKYNRIDIKIYITYTIFNYNTISLRYSFFPVPVKGLYQTAKRMSK
jgi:hypothetical protein